VRDVVAAWAGRWPVLGRHERAAEWLQVWAGLGRAPRTIDAYARGPAEYLQVCERDGTDLLIASRAQVAAFVRELASRPGARGANVVSIDSGAGLANATQLPGPAAARPGVKLERPRSGPAARTNELDAG
jgi:integrase/recombinase XerD